VFQARNDYGRLLTASLGVLREGGLIFASNNTADWEPVSFLETLRMACREAGRRIRHEHYAPQPPDFPVSRAEPAHLKTVWLRLAN
jgi:23S rRNA G2069 N7-methylase RlmK/C1962 C5-methylase RlmI